MRYCPQPKQPTVSQLESAKRLSQGLSVASNKPHSVRRNQPGLGESLSVVLDANSSEYLLTAQPQQEAPWPSTKANR